MAIASKTRSMIEGFVKDGSFKWLARSRNTFDEDLEEMGKSSSDTSNWIAELSPIGNAMVRRCSKILGIPAIKLREIFDDEAPDNIKEASQYARNFLEYCCFRALAMSTKLDGYLDDKLFRRLTFNMMIAWEFPAASSKSISAIDEDATVGVDAFSRIAPAVPIISNVIISENLFEVLTMSTGGRLQFSTYDKYLIGLERALRRLKSQTESSLLSSLRSAREEKILEIDGTVTSQPVLQHLGISAWPGRLILTDHALYFEAHRVVSFDKASIYDLAENLNQVVKPELTGPWGTRLFDKGVSFKSNSLSEPVVMEFPELKGHTRRDYWLAIIREILLVHRFMHKFHITGVEREEALMKSVLGILRVHALREIISAVPLCCETLLMFNVCNQLPGGDLILEKLASMTTRKGERANEAKAGTDMYSISALSMASNLGFPVGSSMDSPGKKDLVVGEIAVGGLSPLRKAVEESRSSYKKVVLAQASVDGVKVDGIDTNMAVMQELLSPVTQLGTWLLSLAHWEHPLKSSAFCLVSSYIIWREWLGYVVALLLIFFAVFMLITRCFSEGKVAELKVIAPPPMNTMEQLLAVQNAVSQTEELIQDGNVVLLKLRALLLSAFPQASEKLGISFLATSMILFFLPFKYTMLLVYVGLFTMYSPPRKANTEKWMRRLREWWFSIPAAPVFLERDKEDKKKK
ncbi:hypothetical protein DCAR_0622796 [Daucus carota subsp. sativus]|uniref:Uncharacterized protein n=2 Tax=Daucus carota subsp. sativus TaxID=79200 RepID=A0A164UVP6_DAUCS|nr:hypothetical protein DCAR_0622796 [Daucus carota subsp. sativus]